jgi:hypothetical protein
MSVLKPKKPIWLYASLGIGALSVLVFLLLSRREPWNAGRAGGLVFGIAASVLFLIDLLYPLRRRLFGFLFQSAQGWIQFHIYGGSVAFFFVIVHSGFKWPAGTLGWLLLGLSFWAMLSGLFGVWLQKWVPALMASGLSVEALFERIPELVARLKEDAESLIQDSSEMLERFYADDVRPVMAGIDPSWGYLLDVRSGRDARLAGFSRLSPFLTEEERPRLEDLKMILTEKLELDAQYSLQRLLQIWVVVHVPPSILLFGIMLFHIWTSLSYM